MNDKELCGKESALIAFLYDDGDPSEREAMAAHVAHCPSCAMAIESLRLTRARLVAWTPPAAALGFRITQDGDASRPATVLTSSRWWGRPLPAWAQVAAAVVIFAGGVAIGAAREESGATATVSQQQIDTLRAEVARLRNGIRESDAGVDEEGVMQRVAMLVNQRVAASELRQQEELDRRTSQLATDFRTLRANDLLTVRNSVAGLEQVTGAELAEQREAISKWNQVFGGAQVIPTSLVR